MDFKKLANALIPDKNLKEPEEYESIYAPRNVPQGAEVTRLAPSPTKERRTLPAECFI